MFRELKLGAVSLLKMATGITKTETGLVSGQQVAAYVEDKLVDIGGGGSGGNWNGGTVTKPTIFDADVQIGTGLPVWIRYSNTNAGASWTHIPEDVVPTRNQINAFVMERTVNAVAMYETASSPNTWLKNSTLPTGWYKVEVMLISPNGDDALNLLNAAAIQSGHVKNVMGLAHGGTDNSSCPYTTWNGITWYNNSGEEVGRAMASIVRLDFLYNHRDWVKAYWLGEKIAHENQDTGWEKGVARYTGILEPQQL